VHRISVVRPSNDLCRFVGAVATYTRTARGNNIMASAAQPLAQQPPPTPREPPTRPQSPSPRRPRGARSPKPQVSWAQPPRERTQPCEPSPFASNSPIRPAASATSTAAAEPAAAVSQTPQVTSRSPARPGAPDARPPPSTAAPSSVSSAYDCSWLAS